MGLGVKVWNLASVNSITKMWLDTTMQVAVSSVNFGSKLKPSAVKNATDRSRFFTGRLTKILAVVLSVPVASVFTGALTTFSALQSPACQSDRRFAGCVSAG